MQEIPFDQSDEKLMERLRGIPAFDTLPDSQIKNVMEASAVIRYDPGEDIIVEGEFDNRVFFLIFGKLSITVQGQQVSNIRRLGDIFGEMGILDGSPRSATITAETPTLCVSLDDSAIGALGDGSKLFTQAVMYRFFAEVMAVRLRDANAQITELSQELEELKKQ